MSLSLLCRALVSFRSGSPNKNTLKLYMTEMKTQIVLLSANGVVLKVSDSSVRIGVFAFLTCQWHFLSLVLDFNKVGKTNV